MGKGGIKAGSVLRAGLGEDGTAPASAAGDLRDFADDVAGMDTALDKVGRGGGEKGGTAIDDGGEDQRRRTELLADTVGHFPQGIGGREVDTGDCHGGAADVDGSIDKTIGDGSHLDAGELVGLAAEAVELGLQAFDAVFEVRRGGGQMLGEAKEAVLLFKQVVLC